MNYKTFSLILATVNRKIEVKEFLDSIKNSDYPLKKIEIVIVDQNEKNFLQEIVNRYRDKIKIIYIKSKEKGLSKNRNIGLKYISNEIVGFPDDDCKYLRETLLNISNNFCEDQNLDGVIGRIIDENGDDCVRKWGKKKIKITKRNFYTKASSITIFEKIKNVKNILDFDEDLGAGAKYGSSEDVDYLYRTLKLGKNINYNPDIIVYHPRTQSNFSKEKAKSYGVGHGVFIRKNFDLYTVKIFFQGLTLVFLRILSGMLTFNEEKIKVWYFSLKGRIKGIGKREF